MGFSITASHLVWGLALISAAGGIASAFFTVEHAMTRGQASMDARASLAAFGRITGTFCYDSTQHVVTATLTNAGKRELSLQNTTFVLDGVPRSGVAWTLAAAAQQTDRWLPGEVAVGNLTGVLSAPTRLFVAPPTGENTFIKLVTCQ